MKQSTPLPDEYAEYITAVRDAFAAAARADTGDAAPAFRAMHENVAQSCTFLQKSGGAYTPQALAEILNDKIARLGEALSEAQENDPKTSRVFAALNTAVADADAKLLSGGGTLAEAGLAPAQRTLLHVAAATKKTRVAS